jgi:hypothetical protein
MIALGCGPVESTVMTIRKQLITDIADYERAHQSCLNAAIGITRSLRRETVQNHDLIPQTGRLVPNLVALRYGESIPDQMAQDFGPLLLQFSRRSGTNLVEGSA